MAREIVLDAIDTDYIKYTGDRTTDEIVLEVNRGIFRKAQLKNQRLAIRALGYNPDQVVTCIPEDLPADLYGLDLTEWKSKP